MGAKFSRPLPLESSIWKMVLAEIPWFVYSSTDGWVDGFRRGAVKTDLQVVVGKHDVFNGGDVFGKQGVVDFFDVDLLGDKALITYKNRNKKHPKRFGCHVLCYFKKACKFNSFLGYIKLSIFKLKVYKCKRCKFYTLIRPRFGYGWERDFKIIA